MNQHDWQIISRERDLTEAEAYEYLTLDTGKVPCSRYGRDSRECAPVAIEVATIHAADSGFGLSTDGLDGAMSAVVNDSDGVADLLNEYASGWFRDQYADLMNEIRPRQSLSSGHFSHDDQMIDALNFLYREFPEDYATIIAKFPEMAEGRSIWSGSWLDTEAMGVDAEYSSWVVDAIEATGRVYWEDGEPWADVVS
jgi:hypothetical protein